jgi:hypothetical protein
MQFEIVLGHFYLCRPSPKKLGKEKTDFSGCRAVISSLDPAAWVGEGEALSWLVWGS